MPPPEYLSHLGIEPTSPVSPALHVDFLLLNYQENPYLLDMCDQSLAIAQGKAHRTVN